MAAVTGSLRARLLLLVLLAVIPALGLMLYTAAEQRRLAVIDAQGDAHRLARLAAGEEEQLIESAHQLLIALAQLPSLRAADPVGCSAIAARLLAQYPRFVNIGAVTPDASVYCSGIPLPEPVSVPDRLYFRRVVETREFAAGEYQIGRIAGEPTLVLAYPVLSDAGGLDGVAFVSLRLPQLGQLATEAQLPQGSSLTIVDRNGTVMARFPDAEAWRGQSLPESELVTILHTQRDGVAQVAGLDGTPRLYGFTTLYHAPVTDAMFIAIGIPTTVAFAGAEALLTRNLVGLGVVAILALVAAWLAGDALVVRPLGALVDATRRLSAGDLSARARLPHVAGEVGTLARAFDEMAAALEVRQAETVRTEAEIRQTNVVLEQRVHERTEELLTAKELADHERAILAAVTTSMSDGLFVLSDRVRYCNTRAAELLGIDLRGVVGQTASEVFAEFAPALADAQLAQADWERALAHRAEQPSFDVVLVRPTRRDVEVTMFEVADATGQPLGQGILLRDVTREREADRLKDELVAIVSHELRTPVSSLVGFTELLLTRDYPPEKREEFLRVMHQEGERLATLVSDFLDLQRLEGDRSTLSMRPIDLASLVDRAATAVGPDPTWPVRLEVPEGLPQVLADSDRVQQVLTNLLGNARKYSPNGGEVRVSVRAIPAALEIAVQDHGLGIPRNALPHLFEKFYRVDNTDHRAIKGTGLGLAICQQIVEAHGGRIWAESLGLGRGARFVFTLPVADSTEPSPQRAGAPRTSPQPT